MFAALNIYKPKGLTSHDVVARLRRIYGLKKVGHLGTLDPLAEGVLPVCLGQATRLIEYFPTGKRYTAWVTLGQTTTTLDSEGDTLTETDCSNLDLSQETLESVLARFRGSIQQQVPLYSAVHVGGKKLYEHARKQERQVAQGTSRQDTAVIALPTRKVEIYRLELLELERSSPEHPVLKLDVVCSSGTYIRSLARDIGDALGCGAYLSGLLRTEHGKFDLTDSVRLETLQTAENPADFLLDPVPYLAIPTLTLQTEDEARRLSNGMRLSWRGNESGPCLAVFENRLLGVVEASTDGLKPIKIFPQG